MAYIRCAGNSGGSIEKKTASGSVATFTTAIPTALADVTSVIGYRESGYTSATAINSKTAPVIDLAPYRTRINNNIGNLALEKLVGVSCVFNQLINKNSLISSGTQLGLTITNNGDGSLSFSGTASATDWIQISTSFISAIIGHKYIINLNGNDTLKISDGYEFSNIVNWNHGDDLGLYVRPQENTQYNIKLYIMVFDLTALFGSEVADYLYTLESGTAGAGVSLFKSLFADDYYPYTANTLMSAKPTSKVIKDSSDQTVATIVYSGNELRGLLKVGNNGLYADGDIDDGSGNTAVRYNRLTLSSTIPDNVMVDSIYMSGTVLTVVLKEAYDHKHGDNYSLYNAICNLFDQDYFADLSSRSRAFAIQGNWSAIIFYDPILTTLEDWNTYLSNNPVIVDYELATPTTAVSTAWSNPIIAKEGGTEEFTDTRTIKMFTGHDTVYGTDMTVNKAEFGATVYGGSVDFTTGEVISNKNADGTDKTAESISITPVPIMANYGANNLMSDTNGDTTVQYLDLRNSG